MAKLLKANQHGQVVYPILAFSSAMLIIIMPDTVRSK